MEEGITLCRTLFPYINKVLDYRFLDEKWAFIANRFLSSLVTHIQDISASVKSGFILYALHLNPKILHAIIVNNDN